MKLILSIASVCIVLCSFTTDNATNWNTKINKNDKTVTATQTHVVNANADITLFVQKSDMITLTENEKYTGDMSAKRHLIILDGTTRKTIYNTVLSNTNINSIDLNVEKDIMKGDENVNSFDVLELEFKNGIKEEKKINTYKIN